MSSIDWLGEVNPSWGYAPLFTLGDPKKIPNRGMLESNLLSLSYGRIIRRDIESSDGLVPASYETYQIVEPGDTILRFTDLQNDQRSLRSGLVEERGIITSAYLSFTPNRHRLNPGFFAHMMRAVDLSKVFYRMGSGVRQSLNWSEFSLMRIPLPPLETQQRIADYLDRETAEIDAAVADLDKYVELLEKRRRIIIVDGFNDPTYNPIVQRLKFLTVSEDHRRIPIKSGDRVAMAGEYPYYGASGIIDYVNDYLWDNEKRLLLSEDGANLVMRNHPVAFVADGQYWVNNHAHVLKCVGDTSPELVALAIEVTSIAHLITGSAQPKLTAAAMGEISFMFPHSAAKQDALLKKLKPELDEIDSLIAESTKLRDLLLKRRSVLITEVVTGRKQV